MDVGTNFSAPYLLAALDEYGISPQQVRYVLLTHVHLDHAGGAGQLMQSLPQATAVLHPRGARHMIDPTRLIAGTVAVYGDARFKQQYGTIVPISEDRVRTVGDGDTLTLGGRELTFLHTEGHARHHYCIVDSATKGIFTGDTFGVSYRELDAHGRAFIMPAAAPVDFDPEALTASIDRLMNYEPTGIYLTHYGLVTDLERLAEDLKRDIAAYVDMIHSVAHEPDRAEAVQQLMVEHYRERVRAHDAKLPESRWLDLLGIDIRLNAQGVAMWFDRKQRRAANR